MLRQYRPRRPRPRMQPLHRLQVVVQDVRPRFDHRPQRGLIPLEVRDQHLDGAPGPRLPAQPDRLREDRRAAIRQVITVDARDDDVLQLQRRDGLRDAPGLVPVQLGGHAMGDRAVLARPRADIPEDQERRGPRLPTLADVGAARLLAHRVQPLTPHQPFQAQVVRPAGRPYLQPARLALAQRDRPLPLQHGQPRRALGLDDPCILALRRVARRRLRSLSHVDSCPPRHGARLCPAVREAAPLIAFWKPAPQHTIPANPQQRRTLSSVQGRGTGGSGRIALDLWKPGEGGRRYPGSRTGAPPGRAAR